MPPRDTSSTFAWRKRFRAWVRQGAPPAGRCGCHFLRDEDLVPAALLRILASVSGRVLIVTADSRRSDQVAAGLSALMPLMEDGREVIILPEVVAHRPGVWIPENEAMRCAAMEMACRGETAIFLTTVQALLTPTISPAGFEERVFRLRTGQTEWEPATLARRLVALDYDHEFEVHAPGEFAWRGGIFDVYTPLCDAPVRLEFFGNEIESMRFFLPDTQRSFAEVDEVRVAPRGAIVAAPENEGEKATFWEYFRRHPGDMVICGPETIAGHLERFGQPDDLRHWSDIRRAALVRHELITEAEECTPDPGAACFQADCVSLAGEIADIPADLADAMGIWRWQQLRDTLERWHRHGYDIVACCAGEGELDRFRELLAGDARTAVLPIALETIPLETGLLMADQRLVMLSEQELFGRRPDVRRRRRSRYRFDQAIHEPMELEEGALAVHASHGICRYHGLRTIETDGQTQEVLELEFDDDARLYVPLEQAFLVGRYVSGSKRRPRLSRLGTVSWRNAKEGAAQSAWDLAAELLRLEAVRKSTKGIAFSAISDWEHSFAASFPYAETEDQAQAIRDVLEDMGKPEPMDRLLCGDVGYGKTEVAMRAAFRAVLNGHQVAVLVPTTILAQQHYSSFRERMAEYPIVIEMLSRFRTRGEQNRILERLQSHQVDIVIGTHRLLQKDVVFADLGLLIIDEEQRFGVQHKQRLKQMRASLDILTMTATPIPRTLYFSLAGIRNLSTIMTAPAERLPVTTVVAQFDADLIRQVIVRELERQGQVYFLYNRVQSIERMAFRIRQLVPEARCEIAHGQMSAHTLEAVMARFLAGEIDVLVCTTIIESGLDIPNVNTIIIDRADRFGLAELYQLRGRVGRYHRQAYAYLLLPPMGALPENARQRLQAVRKYTHLGAGFKLALRDLEIRGAGNILGTEQSGHIAAVGFELYCQLLDEAVARLSEKPRPVRELIPVKLPSIAFADRDAAGRTLAVLPAEYITEESARIECYRRIARLRDVDQVEELAAELRDRYGEFPPSVEILLLVARVRIAASRAGVHSVSVQADRVLLETERGLIKERRGGLPRLVSTSAADRLREIEKLLDRHART